jgi:hypothetical protein
MIVVGRDHLVWTFGGICSLTNADHALIENEN